MAENQLQQATQLGGVEENQKAWYELNTYISALKNHLWKNFGVREKQNWDMTCLQYKERFFVKSVPRKLKAFIVIFRDWYTFWISEFPCSEACGFIL